MSMYLAIGALCICGVLEGIEHLFQSNDLLGLFIYRLPHDTVCALSQLLKDLEFSEDVGLEFLGHDR